MESEVEKKMRAFDDRVKQEASDMVGLHDAITGRRDVGAVPNTFVEIGGRYYRVTMVKGANVRLMELDAVRSAMVRAELESRKVRL